MSEADADRRARLEQAIADYKLDRAKRERQLQRAWRAKQREKRLAHRAEIAIEKQAAKQREAEARRHKAMTEMQTRESVAVFVSHPPRGTLH